MSQPNPYQTPQSLQPPVLQSARSTAGGLWRQDKLLVLHKNAPLPDVCLKSNEPASRRLRRKLAWHHPATRCVSGAKCANVLACGLGLEYPD